MPQEPSPSAPPRKAFLLWFALFGLAVALIAVTVVSLAQKGNGTNTATTNQSQGSTNTAFNGTLNTNSVPTTNISTADWVTYPDSGLGFGFQYPPDWTVVTLPDPKAGLALRSGQYEELQDAGVTYRGELYLNAISNPSNLTLEERFASMDDTSRFWFQQYAHSSRSLGSNQAVVFSPFQETGSSITRIELLLPGNGLIASFSYLFRGAPTASPTLEAIASSVAFTTR